VVDSIARRRLSTSATIMLRTPLQYSHPAGTIVEVPPVEDDDDDNTALAALAALAIIPIGAACYYMYRANKAKKGTQLTTGGDRTSSDEEDKTTPAVERI